MFADLSGKVALVTGGGQGLGLGIVLKLAGQGADIAIGDLSEENAAAAAKQVEAMGRKAYVANMNVPMQLKSSTAKQVRSTSWSTTLVSLVHPDQPAPDSVMSTGSSLGRSM